MSVRTHAPDCAKTQQLLAFEANGPERTPVTAECTCGATYGAGAATSDEFEHACREASRLEQERDEARRLAEKWRDDCLLGFGFFDDAAKREGPLPWEAVDG